MATIAPVKKDRDPIPVSIAESKLFKTLSRSALSCFKRSSIACFLLHPQQSTWDKLPHPSIPRSASGEEGDALHHLRPPDKEGRYSDGVHDTQHQADMDRGVYQALPCELPLGQSALHPDDEAINHRL